MSMESQLGASNVSELYPFSARLQRTALNAACAGLGLRFLQADFGDAKCAAGRACRAVFPNGRSRVIPTPPSGAM